MSYTEEDRLAAAEWFIDIHDVEDPSPELLHNWMRWMEASEAHRLAFDVVEQVWRDSGTLEPPKLPSIYRDERDGYDGSVPVAVWRERRRQRIRGGSKRQIWRGGRGRWLAIAAATDGFTGFAVGRTIWWDALRAFTADGDADAAVRAVTARYLDLEIGRAHV